MFVRLISYVLFPTVFIAAMSVAVLSIERGLDHDLILAGITAAVVWIVATFERLIPEHDEWNLSRGDVGTDLLHGLVSMVLLPQLLELGIRLSLLGTAVYLAKIIGGNLWPSGWPLLAQLVPAMLISQLGEYWVHRAMHEVPWLWRLHATHHSPERLYWLNAGRFHPLDSALLFVLGMAPLTLLGAGPEVMLMLTVWISVHGIFQHCNIKLRLGPLNYIFSMAELHRWHHSLNLDEANANYGNNILFWDLVFGTVYYPRDRRASRDIGLSDMPDFPKNYIGQILSPCRWERHSESKD